MEIDLTVLLNLKCEEIQDNGTPIMARTDDKFKILNLPEGVEFNSISNSIHTCKNYQGYNELFSISCFEP